MSSFISHFQHDLACKVLPPSSVPSTPTTQAQSTSKHSLRTYFLGLEPPKSLVDAQRCLDELRKLQGSQLTETPADEEEAMLRRAIVGKLLVGLYIQALEVFLREASDADTEYDWWNDVTRSQWNVAFHLLQTLPIRLLSLTQTVIHTVRKRDIPLHPSILTPSSLRQLFPTTNVLRPNALTVSLFPYLRYQPYSISVSFARLPTLHTLTAGQSLKEDAKSTLDALATSIADLGRMLTALVTFPIGLTRGECSYKQKELEKIRNERAEVLGKLADLRHDLLLALQEPSNSEGAVKLAYFTEQLNAIVANGGLSTTSPTLSPRDQPHEVLLGNLHTFINTTLPTHYSLHTSRLDTHDLLRPSRLTLLWPRIVFLPPLLLYAASSAYSSRASLDHVAREAWNTVKSFWEGWLLGPLKDVIKTVRTSGEDGVIVTQASVKADLESLERMCVELARDKLNYTPEQMSALTERIRVGDLTAVMQLYEADIKNPLKSAVGGTLLRTLFVQVQKAKVDINQALSGIDKLLKSQELTFAFVGVAPALAIVYAFAGYVSSVWRGGRGRGLYGGRKRKARVWLSIRRIERLLITQPRTHAGNPGSSRHRGHEAEHDSTLNTNNNADSNRLPHVGPGSVTGTSTGIPPLTSGLLLLEVTHLRRFGEKWLPVNSRLREGFLEDVADLENTTFGRGEKLRVVDRMWKSWGGILGWETAAMVFDV